MMYVTPVIYPVKMLDNYPMVKGLMLWLNPISGVITNARAGLLGQGAVDFGVLGISLLMSVVYFCCRPVLLQEYGKVFRRYSLNHPRQSNIFNV